MDTFIVVPSGLTSSNVDWEISRVAESESESESLQPINTHNNGSRNINLVFINKRVFYINIGLKDNVFNQSVDYLFQ